MIVAMMTGVPAPTLHKAAATFLVARTAYTFVYVHNETVAASLLRSTLFSVGALAIASLLAASLSRLL